LYARSSYQAQVLLDIATVTKKVVQLIIFNARFFITPLIKGT
jgi:hypothetical protein